MVGCVFLSQNWAPLVKKIYKWLAAFFCPKIGHHSLKKDFSHFFWPRKKSLFAPELENYQTKIFNSVWHQKPTTDFLQWICYKLTSTEFTNGWLRFFVPKLGTTREKNKWLAAFFCPKIGVKKIYKLAAFFCPKIGHHSLKKDFSHFFWPRKKSLFTPELENYQTKIFNSVWHQKPTTDFLQWIRHHCYNGWLRFFVPKTSTEFTNDWLRFFVPKLGTPFTRGCVFLSQKLGTNLVEKIYKWLAAFFCPKNWAPLVEKIHKWLAAFFCPKIGHHSLKKFTNGWLRFFVPKLGTRFFTFFLAKKKKNWKTTKQKFLIWLHHWLKKFTNFAFLSQNWAPLVKKNLQMVGCVFLSQNWAPLVKKIYKWLAAFFCPKIGHHSLKKFTNGWLRFFVPKLGTTREKNLQMVGCVFLSQNWAPLVKKIYKWLAAFFCPKIGHHSLKKDFSHFFWPRKKSLFTPELENYQTKIFNSVWHQKPTTDFLQWICYKLTSTEFTNGWLRFFVPKLGTTR